MPGQGLQGELRGTGWKLEGLKFEIIIWICSYFSNIRW